MDLYFIIIYRNIANVVANDVIANVGHVVFFMFVHHRESLIIL